MRYDLKRGLDDFQAALAPTSSPQRDDGCVLWISAAGVVIGSVVAVEAPEPYVQVGSRLVSACVDLGVGALRRHLANRAA